MITRHARTSRARLRLLGGAAACALGLAGAPALAQDTAPVATQPGAAASTEVRPEYGTLGERGFYLEADELFEDDTTSIVTARGNVEGRYQGRTVRARELQYERRTGRVLARGAVRIVNPDGTVQFADEIELDDQFRAGVAVGFSTRLAQNVKIAAARATRRSEDVQELDRAIYTPCNVCVEDGVASAPTFSIQAERVTQDRRRRVIVYRNAVLRVFGAPVLALPYFAHPDPTAERASGLLIPRVGLSDRRGLSYEQPYLHVISPSADIVISPQINTKVNPFLNLDYRQRFYSGDLQVRAGYTFERDFNGEGQRFGDQTSRSYILGRGDFDLNERWSYGFSAERVSDDTLFDRYSIQDVFDRRGLYQADSRRLLSQVYTQRQDARSYLSVAALSFQGLRSTDRDSTFPTVAPLVEARWEPRTDVLGGRLRLSGGGVLLTRSETPACIPVPGVVCPPVLFTDGTDSARATGAADWRRSITFANGARLEPFAYARADLYGVSSFRQSDSEFAGRAAGSVGVDFSWPFVRVTPNITYTLEPLAQLSLNAETDIDDRVPNEDSLVFELDETNLFRFNRFPGFDRFEDGLIFTAGGRATARTTDGRAASLFVGRSFRSRVEDAFPARTGLREETSDWVVAADVTPIAGLTAFTRARFDNDDGTVNRAEVGLNVALRRVAGTVRYLYDDTDLTGVTRHDLQYSGQVFVTERFGFVFLGVRDLDADVQRYSEIGVVYQDECVRLEIVYERDNTINRALGPSQSIQFRLTLATLGGVGYRDYDTR